MLNTIFLLSHAVCQDYILPLCTSRVEPWVTLRAWSVTQMSSFGPNVFGRNAILAQMYLGQMPRNTKRAVSNPNQNHNNPIKTRGQSSQLPHLPMLFTICNFRKL